MQYTMKVQMQIQIIQCFSKLSTAVLSKKKSQDFHYLDKKPLTWGCLYTLWEVPIARI